MDLDIHTPAEDLVSLETLSPSECEAWLAMRIAHYQRCMSALHSVHNQRVPLIHRRLPPEVLIEIFSCFGPTSCHDIRITHVCRLWRHLIQHTPDFWVALLPNFVLAYLDESGRWQSKRWTDGLRMVLSLSQPYSFPVPKRRRLSIQPNSPSYALLRPHFSRISRLSAHIPLRPMLDIFLEILKEGMPCLEDLTITHTVDDQEAPVHGQILPAIVLPRLRSLSIPISLWKIPIFSPLLSSLVILPCRGCQTCEGSARLQAILDLLHRCPHLARFEYLAGFSESPSATITPDPHVDLLELQHLHIFPSANAVSCTSALLSRLSFPRDVCSEVHIELYHARAEYIPSAIGTLLTPMAIDTVEFVCTWTAKWSLSCYRDERAFLHFHYDCQLYQPAASNSVPTAVRTIFPSTTPSVHSLRIEYSHWEAIPVPIVNQYIEAFRHTFAHIKDLTLEVRYHSHLNLMRSPLEALRPSPAEHAATASERVLFPELEHLAVVLIRGWIRSERSLRSFNALCDDTYTALNERLACLNTGLKQFSFTFRDAKTGWGPEPQHTPEQLEQTKRALVERFAPYAEQVVVDIA